MKQLMFILIAIILIGCNAPSADMEHVLVGRTFGTDLLPIKVVEYNKELGNANNIVFLGDSRMDFFPMGNYYTENHIINLGQGGSTTLGVIIRIPTAATFNPKKVIVSIGINDNYYGHSVDDILNNFNDIIDQLKTDCPSATIYITNIVPSQHYLQWVADVNAQLPIICASKGVNYLPLTCLETSGVLNPSYAKDEVHYNTAGYNVLAPVFESLF